MAGRVTAIYPGSFDPVTNGHLDIIERASFIFDGVIVALLSNVAKAPLFSTEERLKMLREVTRAWDNVQADMFEGLLVDYAVARKAEVILRGLRAVTDYDYEFQMALMNRRIQPQIETIFMMPAEAYSYLSSSLVKEVCLLGGNVHGLVPPVVETFLEEKVGRGRRKRRKSLG